MDPHCKELCSHSFLHCTKHEQMLEISGGKNKVLLAHVEIGHIFPIKSAGELVQHWFTHLYTTSSPPVHHNKRQNGYRTARQIQINKIVFLIKLNLPSRRIKLFFNFISLFVRQMSKFAVERVDIWRKRVWSIHKKHIEHDTVSPCFFRLHRRWKQSKS